VKFDFTGGSKVEKKARFFRLARRKLKALSSVAKAREKEERNEGCGTQNVGAGKGRVAQLAEGRLLFQSPRRGRGESEMKGEKSWSISGGKGQPSSGRGNDLLSQRGRKEGERRSL